MPAWGKVVRSGVVCHFIDFFILAYKIQLLTNSHNFILYNESHQLFSETFQQHFAQENNNSDEPSQRTSEANTQTSGLMLILANKPAKVVRKPARLCQHFVRWSVRLQPTSLKSLMWNWGQYQNFYKCTGKNLKRMENGSRMSRLEFCRWGTL